MNIIYKYKLLPGDNIVQYPAGHKIVMFNSQGDDLTIWVYLDKDKPYTVKRTLRVFATGEDIPDNYHHLSSCKMYGDKLIFHLFEKKE